MMCCCTEKPTPTGTIDGVPVALTAKGDQYDQLLDSV